MSGTKSAISSPDILSDMNQITDNNLQHSPPYLPTSEGLAEAPIHEPAVKKLKTEEEKSIQGLHNTGLGIEDFTPKEPTCSTGALKHRSAGSDQTEQIKPILNSGLNTPQQFSDQHHADAMERDMISSELQLQEPFDGVKASRYKDKRILMNWSEMTHENFLCLTWLFLSLPAQKAYNMKETWVEFMRLKCEQSVTPVSGTGITQHMSTLFKKKFGYNVQTLAEMETTNLELSDKVIHHGIALNAPKSKTMRRKRKSMIDDSSIKETSISTAGRSIKTPARLSARRTSASQSEMLPSNERNQNLLGQQLNKYSLTGDYIRTTDRIQYGNPIHTSTGLIYGNNCYDNQTRFPQQYGNNAISPYPPTQSPHNITSFPYSNCNMVQNQNDLLAEASDQNAVGLDIHNYGYDLNVGESTNLPINHEQDYNPPGKIDSRLLDPQLLIPQNQANRAPAPVAQQNLSFQHLSRSDIHGNPQSWAKMSQMQGRDGGVRTRNFLQQLQHQNANQFRANSAQLRMQNPYVDLHRLQRYRSLNRPVQSGQHDYIDPGQLKTQNSYDGLLGSTQSVPIDPLLFSQTGAQGLPPANNDFGALTGPSINQDSFTTEYTNNEDSNDNYELQANQTQAHGNSSRRLAVDHTNIQDNEQSNSATAETEQFNNANQNPGTLDEHDLKSISQKFDFWTEK